MHVVLRLPQHWSGTDAERLQSRPISNQTVRRVSDVGRWVKAVHMFYFLPGGALRKCNRSLLVSLWASVLDIKLATKSNMQDPTKPHADSTSTAALNNPDLLHMALPKAVQPCCFPEGNPSFPFFYYLGTYGNRCPCF